MHNVRPAADWATLAVRIIIEGRNENLKIKWQFAMKNGHE